MKLINRADGVVSKINESIQQTIDQQTPRTYLGASWIGKECDRELWYSYHQPVKIDDTRVQRIMDIGHLFESYALSMLKKAGYEVFHEDGDGNQYGFKDGILQGNSDGVIIIDEIPHLLEIKSANEKRFNEMVKVGVKISDPVYYYQMQTYMKYMELDKSLFFVINKNDCNIHAEVVDFDPIDAEYIVNRGKNVITGEIPNRKYPSKAFYKCKFCKYSKDCWNE